MLTKYAEGLLSEPLPHDIDQCIRDLATADHIAGQPQNDWEDSIFSDPNVQAMKNRLNKMVESLLSSSG
jgi:hypothetical protein